jgi:hypothetical protein
VAGDDVKRDTRPIGAELALKLSADVMATQALRLGGEQSRDGGRSIGSIIDEVDVGARGGAIVQADAGDGATSGADARPASGAAEVRCGNVGEVPEVTVERGVGVKTSAAVVHEGGEGAIEQLILAQTGGEGAVAVDECSERGSHSANNSTRSGSALDRMSGHWHSGGRDRRGNVGCCSGSSFGESTGDSGGLRGLKVSVGDDGYDAQKDEKGESPRTASNPRRSHRVRVGSNGVDGEKWEREQGVNSRHHTQ